MCTSSLQHLRPAPPNVHRSFQHHVHRQRLCSELNSSNAIQRSTCQQKNTTNKPQQCTTATTANTLHPPPHPPAAHQQRLPPPCTYHHHPHPAPPPPPPPCGIPEKALALPFKASPSSKNRSCWATASKPEKLHSTVKWNAPSPPNPPCFVACGSKKPAISWHPTSAS